MFEKIARNNNRINGNYYENPLKKSIFVNDFYLIIVFIDAFYMIIYLKGIKI